MDENLKSIRRIHYAVAGVSMAIFAIGLTPSRAQKYNAALREAEIFESLDLSWLWPDPKNRSALFESRSIQTDALAFALWQAGNMTVELEFPDSAYYPNQYAIQTMQYPQPPVYPRPEFLPLEPVNDSVIWPSPPKDTTISGLLEYLGTDMRVYRVLPVRLSPESSSQLADRLGCPRPPPNSTPKCRISRILSARPDTTGFHLAYEWYSLRDSAMHNDTLHFQGEHQELTDLKHYLLPHLRERWRPFQPEGEKADSILLHGFPSLARLRSEIKDLRRSELPGYLKGRSLESRQRTQMLGVLLDEQFIAIVGPFFLIVSMIYLYLHQSHLLAICTRADLHVLRTFPWSPLYPGRDGTAVGIITLLILPTGAVVVITVSAWKSSQSVVNILHLLSSTLTPLVGLFCLSRVRALRKCLYQGGIADADLRY